jgi:hypothetical protein
MTIGVADRRAALKRALVRLAELCGDARSIRFGETDLLEASPLRTTIDELQDAGFIEQIAFSSNREPYALKMKGWFQAQRLSGRFDCDEFQKRRGRLCAAMKHAVNSRRDEAIIDCSDLANAVVLPDGWVWNMLERQVLHRLDPKGRYLVRFEDGNIYVPATFGQEPATLD